MNLVVCAVRDRAVNSFGNPFFVTTVGQAIRSFADAINGKESDVAKHPEDYDLWTLGSYESDTGYFTQDGGPRQVAVGKELVVKA